MATLFDPISKCPPRPAAPRPQSFGLRDYQRRGVAAIKSNLSEYGSTLVVMPTGTGKTVLLAHAIKECAGGKRALVMAHRKEINEQNARTIEAVTGQRCALEMADSHADLSPVKAQVIVASKDSLHAKRLIRFNPAEFGLIVTDECFPSGTDVGGRSIETIQVGDRIPCWNHTESRAEFGRVVATFKSKPSAMVRVHLEDGSITCTPCHPIWTDRGYVPAEVLTADDMVSRLHHDIQENMQAVQSGVRGGVQPINMLQEVRDGAATITQKNNPDNVLRVPQGCCGVGRECVGVFSEGEGVLLGCLQGSIQEQTQCAVDGGNQSKTRIGENEEKQSNAQAGCSPEGFRHHEGDGDQTDLSRRQWQGSNRAGADACGGSRLANRICSANQPEENQSHQTSLALQNRRGESDNADRRGNRRTLSQNGGQAGTGQKENRILERVRVDRVEILEPTGDGTFDGVCPDGFVYNVEVERHHNYLANGLLVHNCHRSVGGSYSKIYEYFKGVPHLGVTATPDRTDESALGQVFASAAMVYEIADAIHDGWLVPVRAHTVYVQSLELANIHTTAGDLNLGELADQLERDRVLHEMAASITKEVDGKRAIVFTASVRQAEQLSGMLNDYQPDSSRWVCGETPKDQRDYDLSEHRAGAFRYMVNCGVLTEGYDDPGCEMIVMGRPTKSRSLFAQCLGRGTRPLPGTVDGVETAALRRAAIAASGKPALKVLDFMGNCGRHKLISPADVLGGKYPDEDISAASAAMMGGDLDVVEALEAARRAREARAENREAQAELDSLRAARQKVMALAKYILAEEDLFDGAMTTPSRERGWEGRGKAPTEPQMAALEKSGFERTDVERLSRAECSKLIGTIIMRRGMGLATMKQVRALSRRGIQNADKMTFAEAGAHLDRLYGGKS